jgi:asparagine synthetase B (glutamine-hydrolysing)
VEENDGLALLRALGTAIKQNQTRQSPSSSSSPNVGSSIKDAIESVIHELEGPWAFCFFHRTSRTLWFGRSWMGQRSLLLHLPNARSSSFVISSVAFKNYTIEKSQSAMQHSETTTTPPPTTTTPTMTTTSDEGDTDEQMSAIKSDWIELPCGLFSCKITSEGAIDEQRLGLQFEDHGWKGFDRNRLTFKPYGSRQLPSPLDTAISSMAPPSSSSISAVDQLLKHLSDAVAIRTRTLQRPRGIDAETATDAARVAILFSGGIDSLVLAALADRSIPPNEPIDLLNVAFAKSGGVGDERKRFEVPDRKSGIDGWNELRTRMSSTRRWNFVEIDIGESELRSQRDHLMRLIYPCCTIMDVTIGAALWFASRGIGSLRAPNAIESVNTASTSGGTAKLYCSPAKVLLSGLGADEQLAGYGRHRTAFTHGGWQRLAAELELDVSRLWQRNLGRDDRLISDNGREVRFPFLDDSVMSLLQSQLPLTEICDLRVPLGQGGDKRLLRLLARRIGLSERASLLTKRAIQFGSSVAKVLFPGKQDGATLVPIDHELRTTTETVTPTRNVDQNTSVESQQ